MKIIETKGDWSIRQTKGNMGYRVYYGDKFIAFYMDLATARMWLR